MDAQPVPTRRATRSTSWASFSMHRTSTMTVSRACGDEFEVQTPMVSGGIEGVARDEG